MAHNFIQIIQKSYDFKLFQTTNTFKRITYAFN